MERGGGKDLRFEERVGVFEGVRLWTWNGAFDSGCIETVGHETGDEEVNSVFETAGVVAGVCQDEAVIAKRVGGQLRYGRMHLNFILRLQLATNFGGEFIRFEELAELVCAVEGQFMSFRDHSEESINSLRDLVFRTRYGDDIARLLGAWEIDLAIPLLLKFFDLLHTTDELPVVQAIDAYGLGHEFSILGRSKQDVRYCRGKIRGPYSFFHHVHDLLLHQIKVLSIASRCTANDVVNLDIVVFLANTATIHSIRELHEDGVFLHNALDVLAAYTNNALVVLVWDMERNGSWHLLFYKFQTVLRSFVV